MNITEAKKRCDELETQMDIIRREYDFGSYVRYVGDEKIEPLAAERDRLFMAIKEAENITEIKI